MTQSNICIRIDENLKKQFDSICGELGFTMSTAINIFVKKVVREKAVPFTLSLNDYNLETQKAIEDVENGNITYVPYTTAREVIQAILEDDSDD